MWHVETDLFAMGVFLIMLIKEYSLRKERKQRQRQGLAQRDIQSDSFYFVLVFSIISVVIDIISSVAMNDVTNWWFYQIAMTIYVISMPLLAAVWVGYACTLIYIDLSLKQILQKISILMIPYAVYTLVAITNPVTGLFFTLSPAIEYKRGILFMPVGVGSIMLYSFMGLLLVFLNWKKISPRSNAVLIMTFFIITTCFI